MRADRDKLIEMEKKFWQSMVDEQTDVALGMLAEPSFMVSSHGAMKFAHASYRQMAEHGNMVIKSHDLGEGQPHVVVRHAHRNPGCPELMGVFLTSFDQIRMSTCSSTMADCRRT